MDQTTPNYPNFVPGASFSNCGIGDYFPYHEGDYDIPGQYNQQQNNFVYPDNTHSILPDSPPEYLATQREYPQYVDHSPPSLPSSYPLSSSAGSGTSTSSSSIPIPAMHPIHHPSYHGIGVKRMRGSTSSTSTSSPMSLKQEDEMDFPYVAAGTGPIAMGVLRPGQIYQEPPFPDVTDVGRRNIEFTAIFQEQWCQAVQLLADGNTVVGMVINDYNVQADKGFNFSQPEDAFICQKKNHFQVTVQLRVNGVPNFVQKVSPNGMYEYHKIDGFYLDLFGVKAEALQQSVKIDQSQSDRSRKEFKAYQIPTKQFTSQDPIILGRLHFVETTANNMRKKGKLNPDQRFFRLVVGFYAEATNPRTGEVSRHLLRAMGSEHIIVRASNPGQFEQDTTAVPVWQRSPHDEESIFHMGNIGINTDNPQETLDIRGNMRLTGRMVQPSDQRAKDILGDADPSKQLENIRKLRIVRYKYKDRVVAALNLNEASTYDTGILAQDVLETIPEAVEIVGDLDLEDGHVLENFLMVNKDRLFMEGLGAVQALSVLADDYGNRLTELERRNLRRFTQLKSREGSFRSNISAATAQTIYNSVGYGNSVSRRASAIPYMRTSAPASPEKQASFSPKILMGKNYIQWMTLGLVLVVSICLLSILGIYISNQSSDKNQSQSSDNSDAPLPVSLPYFYTTVPTPPNITDTDGTGTYRPSSTEPTLPGQETFPPEVIATNKPQTLLDLLFPNGPCYIIQPISVDKRCVADPVYAAEKCKPSSLINECCQKTNALGVTSQSTVMPEERFYPEFRSNSPESLQDLMISFDLNDQSKSGAAATSDPLAAHNLVPQTLNDGQAVLYMPNRVARDADDDLTTILTDPLKCKDPPTISDPVAFEWPLVTQLFLEEPDLTLTESYCFRKDGNACGYENTFLIPLPISKYYDKDNITLVFRREPNTVLKICEFNVMYENCFRQVVNTPMHLIRADRWTAQVVIPVGSFAHSQIRIRVAPSALAEDPTPLCLQNSPQIFKYEIVSGRSCR